MTLQKLNIQPKVDNAAKKQMVTSNEIGVNETLQASEVNAIVNKVNEVVDAYNFASPITAFNFKENVATYADLPLVGNEINDGYGVIADGLVYVWNGEAFPSQGQGMDLGLKPLGEVEENNPLAVNGGKVWQATKPITNFTDFNSEKPASAEIASLLNSQLKLFYSTEAEPTISGNIITFGLSYIFSNSTAYIRLNAGTLDLTAFFTAIPTDDRFTIYVKALNLLKRTGGVIKVPAADLKVVRWAESADYFDNDCVMLFNYDRVTGILQSPFITAKKARNDFSLDSAVMPGSASNDLVLNTTDKLMFSSIVDPYITTGNILTWAGGFIFNATTNGYISVTAGTLDLNPYITGISSADRYFIYINALDVLNRTRTSAKVITSADLIVQEFRTADVMNKGAIVLFEWDRANSLLKSPFFNQFKSVDAAANLSKLQYTGRASFTFDKINKSVAWSSHLYIFNRGAGLNASTYLRINPGSISFAQKVVDFPTDDWFVAYINSGSNLVWGQSSGSLGSITPESIILKSWSEDTSDVRRREFLPIFYYNKFLNTIQSPFLHEIAQTKALETQTTTNVVTPWFNKYPNVNEKLKLFFQKYLYSQSETAENKTRIISLGNSLLARHEHTSVLNVVPSENPPTLITKNIMAYLFEKLKGIKPLYKRYDTVFFTETGTFATTTNAGWDDNGDIFGTVKASNTDNANVLFTIPTDHDYFNFIDRKHNVTASSNVVVSVGSGNGVVQCRLEGQTAWVEANGFSFSQVNGTANASLGVGNTQFQRRIEFKKVSAGIGVAQAITIQNNAASTMFNYWGVELIPNGKRYTQLINVARGGHTFNTSGSSLANYVQTDVFDRKPDLVILEIPLLNMVAASVDIETNVNSFIDFVYGDRLGFENALSLKNKSNNWVDFQVLLIIPHHSRVHFATNSKFAVQSNGYTVESIYNAIKGEIIKRGDLPFIDISTVMLSAIDADALYNGDYYTALRSSGITGNGYMNDSLHPNDKGTLIWAKELCPIFFANTN